MKKLIALLITLSVFPFVSNAQWNSWKKIKGNGNVITKNVITTPYDEIVVAGIFDVTLVKGKVGKISIECEENLAEYIEIEVKGNELKIAAESGYNLVPSRSKAIKVTVPFDRMKAASLSGSGTIQSAETISEQKFSSSVSGSGTIRLAIKASDVAASVTGSGDLSLKGTADNLKCSVTGSGDLDASGLQSKTVDAMVKGSGDCQVFCSDSLEARVTGSGDILYRGDPAKKDTKVTGSGDIKKG